MPLSRPWVFGSGVLVLVAVWLFPLPQLAVPSFTKHMIMHMGVVAVAAPLVALGVAGGSWDPIVHHPRWHSAVVASMIELVIVWSWHAPALHHLAREGGWALAAEQASFLIAGGYLWLAALGGTSGQRHERSVAGLTGLLLTSMHMTLLGALLALTPRVLYVGHHHDSGPISTLTDQRLGGAIMLVMGAAAYLVGGLWLAREAWFSPRKRGEQR